MCARAVSLAPPCRVKAMNSYVFLLRSRHVWWSAQLGIPPNTPSQQKHDMVHVVRPCQSIVTRRPASAAMLSHVWTTDGNGPTIRIFCATWRGQPGHILPEWDHIGLALSYGHVPDRSLPRHLPDPSLDREWPNPEVNPGMTSGPSPGIQAKYTNQSLRRDIIIGGMGRSPC